MRVAMIGAGAMGKAISSGAHNSAPDNWDFVFFDPHHQFAEAAAQAVDGAAVTSAEEAVADADLVVLAVKPQVQHEVIKGLPVSDACFISIAAGRSIADMTADFEAAGNDSVALVRVMPNVNAMVGMAATAVSHNDNATDDQVANARQLFDSIGVTFDMPEDHFSAFTAMAGSSPAWFFAIVDHLARAGVKHGLTKAEAVRAANAAMAGSAKLLARTLDQGGNASQLIDQVCSPGGTTIAGLLAAESAGLGSALVDAVDATVARDRELGTHLDRA